MVSLTARSMLCPPSPVLSLSSEERAACWAWEVDEWMDGRRWKRDSEKRKAGGCLWWDLYGWMGFEEELDQRILSFWEWKAKEWMDGERGVQHEDGRKACLSVRPSVCLSAE